jgi:inhibitor of KinA
MRLEPLGDVAVVATLGDAIDPGTLGRVLAFAAAVDAAGSKAVTDIVPAYATVTVFYDSAVLQDQPGGAYEAVCRLLETCATKAGAAPAALGARTLEIPVCYGEDYGPDIDLVAEHCRMGVDEVIALHSGADYLVHAIGFTPGFPYLGGLPDALKVPRKDTPRSRVPAGSVAIGNSQTGVYPMPSPGGWQIIGRTPMQLFRPLKEPASLLKPGDRVRFRPMSPGDFELWR